MLDASWGNNHMHRNEIFNTQLKEVLRDDIFAQQWINFIGDFNDGSNYKINSVGELTVDQLSEATSLPDRRPDSGQFVFNINEAIGIKTAFTDWFLEEDFMAPQVLQTLPDRMTRAVEEYMETRMLRLQREQTANAANTINGAAHRFVANGTGRTITLADLAYIVYGLKKAAVGDAGLVGIVDPSFEFNTNISSQVTTSDNPRWEGIIESGMGKGFRFIRNIYGIDLYTSNYLDTLDAQEGSLADYQGNTTAGEIGDKANVFFSARDKMLLPFIGAWRRRPSIESWRDPDKATEYHQLTARFGLDLWRHENLTVCVSSTTLN